MQPLRLLLLLMLCVVFAGLSGQANAAPPPPAVKPPAAPPKNQAVWKTPHPPYPLQARGLRQQGDVELKISTNATGRVVKVFLLHSPAETASESIKDITMKWAIYYWSGPPNSTKTVIVSFLLG